MKCTSDQVAVFPGALHPHSLLLRMLVDAGDTVVCENPGFPYIRQMLKASGANVKLVPVDTDGIQIGHLANHINNTDRPVKLVYVTPTHHDPSGAVMSLPRRKDLIELARKHKFCIVEDDYDSAFRYGGTVLPYMQGLDEYDTVFHIGTLWKLLFPLTTLGYLVIPRSLSAVFAKAETLMESNFPLLEQYALTEFINAGYLERHVTRLRTIYKNRLNAMVHSLTKNFRGRIEISKESASTHFIAVFDFNLDSETIANCARESNLPLASTITYYAENPRLREFIVAFALVPIENVEERVKKFKNCLISAGLKI